jgi:predicted nuclease of predicted toxin-antitoxin system
MKLLLDENLSRRIVPDLQDAFPASTHVSLIGLEKADDRTVWNFAKTNGFIITTKDDDFMGLLSLYGYPPKVILLALGNCTNAQVSDALHRAKDTIETMLASEDIGLVTVY